MQGSMNGRVSMAICSSDRQLKRTRLTQGVGRENMCNWNS